MTSLGDRLLRRLASLLVRGPDAPIVLGDLDESMRRDLERGMSPGRARLRYLKNAMGSASSLWRERIRRGLRRLPAPPVSLLDVKLGVRMLFKHPGLTAVTVFALALGIPASLGPFHLLNMFETTLPFDEGERIVGLGHSYVGRREAAGGTFHLYSVWRETVSSMDEIGAARSERFNLAPEDGPVAPWRGARMTASTFRILRVLPLLGRPLLDADEVVGAPDVVVLGYDPWQSIFGGDPSAVGRTLRIGGTPHTVVGVMPEGFLFPARDHLWIPLRTGPTPDAAGTGPDLWIYGRLADGITQAQAQSELTNIERGLDEAFPDAYAHVRPEVVPFTYMASGITLETRWIFAPIQLVALLLLAVACGNVGTLIMARTATRSGEVAVRTALGASRTRIVSQLFIESLLLALLATGIGLVLAHAVTERIGQLDVWDDMPFWLDWGLTPRTVAQALGLAVFSAVLAGVLPAIKATGGRIQGNLQRAAARGSRVRFGRATTALIVTEVALGVACVFAGWATYQWIPRLDPPQMAIRSERFLSARLTIPEPVHLARGDDAAREEVPRRIVSLQLELARRLEAEPAVRGVAFASTLPGQYHPGGRVEVEGVPPTEDGRGHLVRRARVDIGFFEGFGQPILGGRDFALSDLPAADDEQSAAVIVNTEFVERVLGGGSAIGMRVRYVASGSRGPGPWYEIVGVVGPLGMIDPETPSGAGLYHPAAADGLAPLRVAIHLTDDPRMFAERLREIAADIDPAALIDDPMPLSEVLSVDRALIRWVTFVVMAIAGISIVLSVASLYALMSFTVAQRTREIGLRSALGADPTTIMSVVVRRALVQLSLGVLIGVAGTVVLLRVVVLEQMIAGWPLLLAGAAAAVLLVGLAACVPPTLRGLSIRPMDALRT